MAFSTENAYPGLGCKPEFAIEEAADMGWSEDRFESYIVFGETVEPDDGWMMPEGPTARKPVDGRLYIFQMGTTISTPWT